MMSMPPRWHSKFRWRSLVTAVSVLTVLSGCAGLDPETPVAESSTAQSSTAQSSTAKSPDPLPAQAPKVIAPPSAAEREGQRLVAINGGAYRTAALDRYLDDIVQRLAAQSDRPDIPYKLTVLDSPAINAFALPSGALYVTRGLLALCNDSAEIAAVIGHEMAHVSQRHALARQALERQSALVSQVMTDVLHDPAGGQAHAQQSLVTIASFSRLQELDADRIGIRTMAHAGFDPSGAARFLVSMSLQQGTGSNDFLASHPSTPERVQQAVQGAAAFGPAGEHDHVGFLEAIDGLPYGEDPQQGFVQGKRFVHPRLGFAFEAPAGFTLDNTPQAVLGADGVGRALRLDAVKPRAGQPLAEYIQGGWMDGVAVQDVEATRLGPLEAATALARSDDWVFRLYALRFDADIYRLTFAARQMTPDTDAAFRQSAASFRRLAPDERHAVKPFRVDVATLRVGDTPQTLAGRMAVPDHALDRFLVLNGLVPGASLAPGERVKIVSR